MTRRDLIRKTMWRCLTAGLASLLLGACNGGASIGGNGGGSSAPGDGAPPPSPPAADESPGGIWQGQTSESDNPPVAVRGFALDSGRFNLVRADGVQLVGNLSVSGAGATGEFELALPPGETLDDGSAAAGGELDVEVVALESIRGTLDLETSQGTSSTVELELDFDPLYGRPSGLDLVEGVYSNLTSPATESPSIDSDGTFFSQNSANGCVINGEVTVPDPRFNLYAIELLYSDCTGDDAVLNGVFFEGLGTLDEDMNPAELDFIVSGEADSGLISLELRYQKS